MAIPSLTEALEQLAAYARGDELARFTRDCLFDAADAKRTDLDAVFAQRRRRWGCRTTTRKRRWAM
jgi:hypothetical protein